MAALKSPNDDLVKGAAIALGAVTLGLLLYEAFRPRTGLAKPASPPGPPGPPGTPAPTPGAPPPGAPVVVPTGTTAPAPTDVVADPKAVAFAFAALKSLASVYNYAAPTSNDLTASDVVAAIRAFQTSGSSVSPPLRTDGVLDWRTWGGLVMANALRQGFPSLADPTITAVNDPALVQMAQNAAAILPQKAVASVIGVTAGNSATQVVQALQKYISSVGASATPTDGTITYLTLAFLITLAYGT